MAKELPYFKYYPSEWVTGDITLCSMASQGLFTNLCSYYWMRNCTMTLANAKQRFSKHEAGINELLEFDIIKVDNNNHLVINFLDEQMNEFINVSKKRAIAGKKGGKAKAKQLLQFAKAKPSNIDKEKIRIKKDIIYNDFYDFEIENSKNNTNYIQFVKILFGENNSGLKLAGVLKLKNQLTFKQFQLVYSEKKKNSVSLTTVLENLENRPDLLKNYSMLQRVLLNWMKTNNK